MFNIILFISLLLILLIVIVATKNDFSCPASLFCLGFLISSFFLMINTNNWTYAIKPITWIIVFSSVLIYVFGCLTYNVFAKKTNHDNNLFLNSRTSNIEKKCFFGAPCHIVLIFIVIICVLARLMDLYLTVGSINIFSGILNTYRHLDGKSSLASLISICTPAITACLILESVELIEMFSNKRRKSIIPFLVVVASFAYYMMSSARIEILYMFVYFMSFLLILFKKNNSKIRIKNVFVIVSLVVFLFLSFFLTGYLTGKSQKQSSIFDNISLYAGSSLATFDDWLNTFSYDGQNFGMTVLRGFHNVLALFGMKTQEMYAAGLGFRNIGTMLHSSNVYSCLPELIADVNFAGMYIVLFFEGFLSTMLHSKMMKKLRKGNYTLTYFYIYLAPVIVFSSISERYFRVFLTLSTLAFAAVLLFVKLFSKEGVTNKR